MKIITKEGFKEKQSKMNNIQEKEKVEIELDLMLKKRILDLELKPIKKKEAKDFSLIDYIGFIDGDSAID